jgi:RNA polymerase sigma-70 factor, ECF subfamily
MKLDPRPGRTPGRIASVCGGGSERPRGSQNKTHLFHDCRINFDRFDRRVTGKTRKNRKIRSTYAIPGMAISVHEAICRAGSGRRWQLDPVEVVQSTTFVSQKDGSDDRNLVLRAVNGDHSAFETLVCRHKGVVRRVARRLTTDVDADDVTQRTFLKAFTNLAGFQFKAGFRTWLVSIAVNEARMWNRKSRRHREVSFFATGTEDDPSQMLDVPDSAPGPEKRYFDEEWVQLLHSEINRLKPQERAAIRACDLEEVSLADAAILFGTTVAALKSRRSRGRATLRKKLLRHLAAQPLPST